ncbi:hypothetical protein ES702_06815 [subsurface metagenome]
MRLESDNEGEVAKKSRAVLLDEQRRKDSGVICGRIEDGLACTGDQTEEMRAETIKIFRVQDGPEARSLQRLNGGLSGD